MPAIASHAVHEAFYHLRPFVVEVVLLGRIPSEMVELPLGIPRSGLSRVRGGDEPPAPKARNELPRSVAKGQVIGGL